MKKVWLSLFVLMSVLVYSKLEAASQYEALRSSVIAGAQTNIQLTTASIRIFRVEVSSGNAGSNFILYGGTVVWNKTSTQTYDTSNTQYKHYVDQNYLGAFFTTTGLSIVRVYWDFLFKAPDGESQKGLDRR